MRGENFTAWNDVDVYPIAGAGLSEVLRAMARHAVLAPSSHNSQPWKFRVEKNTLLISPDLTRALPESDANHRQLYVSVGCAVEHAAIAADFFGYDTDVELTTTGAETHSAIRLHEQTPKREGYEQGHLARYISGRRTNRGKYAARDVAQEFLNAASALSTDAVRVTIISDEVRKLAIARVVSDALIEAMDDTGFRRELSWYIRPNITRAKTGMPMYGFGMPTPPSFLAPLIVRLFNVNRPSRKKDEELLIHHTPAFVIISTQQDNPAGWIAAGRVMGRLILEAERCGMATGPLAAAIQIGKHYMDLQKAAGIQERPQAFFRVGYPTEQPPHSPRIPAREITE